MFVDRKWAHAPAVFALALSTGAPSHAEAPRDRPRSGLCVVALDEGSQVAWPLAQALYKEPSLLPPHLDESRARALAGERPAPDAPSNVVELWEIRRGVRGEDAASRSLLDTVAREVGARGVVLVDSKGDSPVARVYDAEARAFDGATYEPIANPTGAWTHVVRSLARSFGRSSEELKKPSPMVVPREEGKAESTPFYRSGWFWGALGGAVFLGAIAFFVARDGSSDKVNLAVEVPR